METIFMYFFAIASVAIVIWMLIKKADIKITLFAVGLLLLYVAVCMDKPLKAGSGINWLDPFQVIINAFISVLSEAGLIILILGGYAAYMTTIGANKVTVYVLTRPLKKIRSPNILVPFVFLLGNLLSLVVPSASNLAIILLATLYPVLRAAGMSSLTTAAVIATTATVMPTPLGGDNVAIAAELAKYPAFSGLTTSQYVFAYHAVISIPTLIFMAVVHYVWQKFNDKKDIKRLKSDGVVDVEEMKADIDTTKVAEINASLAYKIIYALLPIFPIILLLIVYIMGICKGPSVSLSVPLAVMISFFSAIVVEVIRHLIKNENLKSVMKDCTSFFKGMANAFDIVILLVAATVFVNGLKSIGLITTLETVMKGTSSSGFVLPLILVLLTALIVLLSGSGTALFYAMVPLMYTLAVAAGINALAVAIPMGLAGNILRAVSPVSAVICIVAGATKLTPISIVKRTSVPMVSGVIFMFILSMIVFL